jgi:hypothetical protein
MTEPNICISMLIIFTVVIAIILLLPRCGCGCKTEKYTYSNLMATNEELPVNTSGVYRNNQPLFMALVAENKGQVGQSCKSDEDCGHLQVCALAAGNEKVGPTCIYSITNDCMFAGVC